MPMATGLATTASRAIEGSIASGGREVDARGGLPSLYEGGLHSPQSTKPLPEIQGVERAKPEEGNFAMRWQGWDLGR